MIDDSLIAFFFLLLSTAAIWLFDKKRYAYLLAGIGVATGLISGLINLWGLISVISLSFAAILVFKADLKGWQKFIATAILFCLSVAFCKHILPGFSNIKILDKEIISADAYPYSFWLNADTMLAGLIIALFGIKPIRAKGELVTMFQKISIPSVMCISTMACLGLLTGIINFDPKVPDFWLIWLITNVLVIALTEEIIFRFLLQNYLQDSFVGFKYGTAIAVIMTSLAFTVYHLPAPSTYSALVFIAGCFYGYIYTISKRIESAIFIHSLLNVAHLFLFSYPMLKATY